MPDRLHVCVFCGSARGARLSYADAGRRLGAALARAGLGLVYGGGRVGMMGIVADAVLDAGGRAVGVIPEALATKEVAHDGLTELHVVAGMHERKALMAERSAAFLTLPGGIGTYEEFFEILTWSALGLHRKPVGILNVEGYFDPLLALLEHAVSERFTRPEHVEPLVVSDDPEAIAHDLLARVPPAPARRWIDSGQT
ncbi:MAG: TIGR00730 family Rossman fold protein [Isosphaeraceae bacterium]|nr:TIGR00730 family Rossman fold protein [Isosphaeraceae bacterium]